MKNIIFLPLLLLLPLVAFSVETKVLHVLCFMSLCAYVVNEVCVCVDFVCCNNWCAYTWYNDIVTQVYIVYFGEHSGEKAFHEIEENHHSYLFSVKKTEEEARVSLLYSYKNIFNGFAALLSSEEASKLSGLSPAITHIHIGLYFGLCWWLCYVF